MSPRFRRLVAGGWSSESALHQLTSSATALIDSLTWNRTYSRIRIRVCIASGQRSRQGLSLGDNESSSASRREGCIHSNGASRDVFRMLMCHYKVTRTQTLVRCAAAESMAESPLLSGQRREERWRNAPSSGFGTCRAVPRHTAEPPSDQRGPRRLAPRRSAPPTRSRGAAGAAAEPGGGAADSAITIESPSQGVAPNPNPPFPPAGTASHSPSPWRLDGLEDRVLESLTTLQWERAGLITAAGPGLLIPLLIRKQKYV